MGASPKRRPESTLGHAQFLLTLSLMYARADSRLVDRGIRIEAMALIAVLFSRCAASGDVVVAAPERDRPYPTAVEVAAYPRPCGPISRGTLRAFALPRTMHAQVPGSRRMAHVLALTLVVFSTLACGILTPVTTGPVSDSPSEAALAPINSTAPSTAPVTGEVQTIGAPGFAPAVERWRSASRDAAQAVRGEPA